MSWAPSSFELTPSPRSRHLSDYSPSDYDDDHPSDLSRYGRSGLPRRLPDRRRRRDNRNNSRTSTISILIDKALDHHGDLGWSLEYATAWCYKHLVGSQTEVTNIIDRIRELGTVGKRTPFIIFDPLDKALFGGKLKGMVYLQWKPEASVSPGTTSAPGIVANISRICMELNMYPFENGEAEIDDLLDSLIHQMIHAFFLICCGAQRKGEKQDGRLVDGLHFGVLMLTIRDISRRCSQGVLNLIFHATKRRELANRNGGRAYGFDRMTPRSFLSIDSKGTSLPLAPADGQSHCCHDNSRYRKSQIQNWQVEEYSRAIDQGFEARGDVVHDLNVEGVIVPTDRLKGPPSATYVELLWMENRVMLPRDKTLAYASLARIIKKYGLMEIKVPECSKDVFKCLYDFIQHGHYWKDVKDEYSSWSWGNHGAPRGPPILIDPVPNQFSAHGIVNQIRLFKMAEEMKFEELQLYVIERLFEAPNTRDDPVLIFKEIYNDGAKQPVHAELHRWVRGFLTKTTPHSYHFSGRHHREASNYEKILSLFRHSFEALYRRCPALKDDVRLAAAELIVTKNHHTEHVGLQPLQSPVPWARPNPNAWQQQLLGLPPFPYTRSWPRLHPGHDFYRGPLRHSLSSGSLLNQGLYDDDPFVQRDPRFDFERDLGLELGPVTSSPYLRGRRVSKIKYYGRDGRLKEKNMLTGEKSFRNPHASTHSEWDRWGL